MTQRRLLPLALTLLLGALAGSLVTSVALRRAPAPAGPASPRDAGPGPRDAGPRDGGPALAPPGDAGVRDAGPAAQRATAQPLLVDVLAPDGRPVPGATVSAQAIDDHGRPIAPQQALEPVGELGVLHGPLPYPADILRGAVPTAANTQKTDPHGTARFTDLAPGPVLVISSHDGLAASAEVRLLPLTVAAPADSSSLRVILRLQQPPAALLSPDALDAAISISTSAPGAPAGSVTGAVIDERTLYLPGARVEAQVGRARRLATTDSRGAFALLALPHGPLSLRVERPGFAPLTVHYKADDPLLREPLRLQLSPGGGIEGEVRDRRGGAPARPSLTLTTPSSSTVVPIAAGGRFRLTGLPPGDATLTLSASGYVPLTRRVQIPPAEHPDSVTVRDLILELDAGGSIAGAVRDGAPGTEILLSDEHGQELGRTTTGARGDFRLGPVPVGAAILTARGRAGQARERVEIRPGSEVRLEIEIPAGPSYP